MSCDIWIDQTLGSSQFSLYSGTLRVGHKIAISDTVCRVGFYLKKTGSPTGTLYARIRKVSDDSIVETSTDTLNVATLTTEFQWCYFNFNAIVDEEVRLLCEYSNGISNHVLVRVQTTNVISGNATVYNGSIYTEYANYDITIKIYTVSVVGGILSQIIT